MRTGKDRVHHEDEVLRIAEEIDAVEDRIRRAVQEGKTLTEARKQHGYHQLQTKR
ncbi:MAG: hypothetical protein LAP40_27075 [Acidobacteriia bacterium]|nr:hypothetical protein [Terriglobia bacterium]